MVNQQLLATYSLLSFIRDSQGDRKEDLILLFAPLLKETVNRKLRKNNHQPIRGMDYVEIQDSIRYEFQIELPIPVIRRLMVLISKECDDLMVLNKDHSFEIKKEFSSSVTQDYNVQYSRIKKLHDDYEEYCVINKVECDFDQLVDFIQDQKNRIFNKRTTVVTDQPSHVSRYISRKLSNKGDKCLGIIQDIYLGGMIANYFRFKVDKNIMDAEVLIDTNFYISLVNLNTEEAYNSCKQLFELTTAMGFRFTILETTVEQIKILLSAKMRDFDNRDIWSKIQQADVLSACERRGLKRSDLESYKDNLRDDLIKKGITIIYNANIRNLYNKAAKSKELSPLAKKRGNRDSAFNDILAEEYVSYKRQGKSITEFADVNCWFLTNSFSSNKRDQALVIWERLRITAPDMLVLLWLANPGLSLPHAKSTLALTNLSANVVKYRADRCPRHKVVRELEDRIEKLRANGSLQERAIAKLCMRMSEGIIGQDKADELLRLPTEALLQFIKSFEKEEEEAINIRKENDRLQGEVHKKDILIENLKNEKELSRMRRDGAVYLVVVAVVFVLGNVFLPDTLHTWLYWVLNCLYFVVTCVVANTVAHRRCILGLVSFFRKDWVISKISQTK